MPMLHMVLASVYRALARLWLLVHTAIRWPLYWRSPPQRKTWCAIFYFVAQEPIGITFPDVHAGDHLDGKLQEALAALETTPFDHDQIHVVYRAIWSVPQKLPKAKVVGGFLAPWTHDFKSCYTPLGRATPLNTEKDLPCFLKWAYQNCPADRYAVFFWGHSYGPVGLFAPLGSIEIPPPPPLGLSDLREAFRRFNDLRWRDVLRHTQTASKPRVDVVLFESCWMSTLETAFDLVEEVQSVIASQSPLPIGLGHPDFIWPYEELLADLLKPGYRNEMAQRIKGFYDQRFAAGQIADLWSIPVALLELDGVAGITQPLKELVCVLKTALDKAARGNLIIGQGRIYEWTTINQQQRMQAGAACLVDVGKLCDFLKTYQDADVKNAAAKLSTALDALVVPKGEALPPGGAALGFSGVSVLYWPPKTPSGPHYIMKALLVGDYDNLSLPDQTKWPGTEQHP